MSVGSQGISSLCYYVKDTLSFSQHCYEKLGHFLQGLLVGTFLQGWLWIPCAQGQLSCNMSEQEFNPAGAQHYLLTSCFFDQLSAVPFPLMHLVKHHSCCS